MPASILSGSLRKDGSFRKVGYVSNIGYGGKVLVNFEDISQVK
jgi:hypothetical protein